MQEFTLVQKAAQLIRQKLEGDGSGHDWWHIDRVWRLARRIAVEEGARLEVVELAAILHDVADWKFCGGDHDEGAKVARAWLLENGASKELAEDVARIVGGVSYQGAGVETPMLTLEGKVVQDADRLDAIGAVGIARTFAYGGSKNRMMYNPEVEPVMHASFKAYKQADGTTINHFYEKLLLLKDRMNTATAKRIAEHRHQVMLDYLKEFYLECEGKQ